MFTAEETTPSCVLVNVEIETKNLSFLYDFRPQNSVCPRITYVFFITDCLFLFCSQSSRPDLRINGVTSVYDDGLNFDLVYGATELSEGHIH